MATRRIGTELRLASRKHTVKAIYLNFLKQDDELLQKFLMALIAQSDPSRAASLRSEAEGVSRGTSARRDRGLGVILYSMRCYVTPIVRE